MNSTSSMDVQQGLACDNSKGVDPSFDERNIACGANREIEEKLKAYKDKQNQQKKLKQTLKSQKQNRKRREMNLKTKICRDDNASVAKSIAEATIGLERAREEQELMRSESRKKNMQNKWKSSERSRKKQRKEADIDEDPPPLNVRGGDDEDVDMEYVDDVDQDVHMQDVEFESEDVDMSSISSGGGNSFSSDDDENQESNKVSLLWKKTWKGQCTRVLIGDLITVDIPESEPDVAAFIDELFCRATECVSRKHYNDGLELCIKGIATLELYLTTHPNESNVFKDMCSSLYLLQCKCIFGSNGKFEDAKQALENHCNLKCGDVTEVCLELTADLHARVRKEVHKPYIYRECEDVLRTIEQHRWKTTPFRSRVDKAWSSIQRNKLDCALKHCIVGLSSLEWTRTRDPDNWCELKGRVLSQLYAARAKCQILQKEDEKSFLSYFLYCKHAGRASSYSLAKSAMKLKSGEAAKFIENFNSWNDHRKRNLNCIPQDVEHEMCHKDDDCIHSNVTPFSVFGRVGLQLESNGCCANCKRKSLHSDCRNPYHFDLYKVHGSNIKKYNCNSPNMKELQTFSPNSNEYYSLCTECCGFLTKYEKKSYSWKFIWPSFYWNLLTGRESNNGRYFTDVYPAKLLLSLVPHAMRKYWEDNIRIHPAYKDCCTVHSHLVDRTEEVLLNKSRIEKYEMNSLLEVLDPGRLDDSMSDTKPYMIPDVLCPWGCSEYPHKTSVVEPCLILQQLLPRIRLNLPSEYVDRLHIVESIRLDYIREDCEDVDYVLLNEQWPVMPTMSMVRGAGAMICCCRHHQNDSVRKRLYAHPPRKMKGIGNLSSVHADQLSPCVLQQRMVHPLRRTKYGVTPATSNFRMSYSGGDTTDFSYGGRFSASTLQHSSMLHIQHSLAGRPDMLKVLDRYEKEGIVSTSVKESFLRVHNENSITEDYMSKFTRGASGCPVWNALKLQQAASVVEFISIDPILSNKQPQFVTCKRTWCAATYNVNVEDGYGYGCRLKAISPISVRGKQEFTVASTLTWLVLGCVSACKELYQCLSKQSSFDDYSPYLLSYIHHKLMKHCDPISDPRNPVITGTKLRDKHVVEAVYKSLKRMDGIAFDNKVESLSVQMNRLFSKCKDVSVCSSIPVSCNDDVVIVVRKTIDNKDVNFVSNPMNSSTPIRYEARVIVSLKKENNKSLQNYSGERYARHGGGFRNWWKQKRDEKIMVQCCPFQGVDNCHMRGVQPTHQYDDTEDKFPEEMDKSSDMFVIVYVKCLEVNVEEYRMDMHASLGGQCCLFCLCDNSKKEPFLPTNLRQKDRSRCSVVGCNRKEAYKCQHDKLTVCSKCFKELTDNGKVAHSFSVDQINSNVSENVDSDEKNDDDDDDDDYNNDRQEQRANLELERGFCSDSDSDSGIAYGGEDNVDFSLIEERSDDDVDIETVSNSSDDELSLGYIVADDCDGDSVKSRSSNASEHDLNCVPRTNAMDVEVPMICDSAQKVPGHVLFNMASSVMEKRSRLINASLTQKSFVQRLANTVFGVSFPILFLQAFVFPKHFWAAMRSDRYSILGCLPISCYRGSLPHPDGFCSLTERGRNLLTHASSSTATDDKHTGYTYDIFTNIASIGHDSREIERSDFAPKSDTRSGLGLGDRDESTLVESMDTGKEMMNLAAASQKHEMDLFLTWTCNQSKHPGIRQLYNWKAGEQWLDMITDSTHMSDLEINDVRKSMDMAYSHVLSRTWLEVRELWVEFILRSTTTKVGPVQLGFFRDEYQGESGNLSHIHAIVKLDRQRMESKEFREFVGDLQKNDIASIVKEDDVKDFIANKKILRDIDDWREMRDTAAEVLCHKCNSKRCTIKTGPKKGQHRCKKTNVAVDSIDPLENEYIDLPFEFCDDCLDILDHTGHYKGGNFTSKIFKPQKHIGKIMPGDMMNLSPVLEEYFVFTRSMQNMQVVTGTNGVARYVVKYIIELDKDNRATVKGNASNLGALKASVEQLTNTKIGRNAVHERSNNNQSRTEKNLKGTVIGTPRMIHRILGDREVRTNIDTIPISTLPFEYRGRQKIRLNKEGTKLEELHLNDNSIDGISEHPKAVRQRLQAGVERPFTDSQVLMLRNNEFASVRFDKVSLFGLRPPELLRMFRNLGQYYEWFSFSEPQGFNLSSDIVQCAWIDGANRLVRIRKCAVEPVKNHLNNLEEKCLTLDERKLRSHILVELEKDDYNRNSMFFVDDGRSSCPVPVFSRVNPEQSMKFLHHIVLVLGEYDTELDLHRCNNARELLSNTNLIGHHDTEEKTEEDLMNSVYQVMQAIIDKIIPVQPISMRRIEVYILRSFYLLKSLILDNSIPFVEIPSCLGSTLYEEIDAKLKREWGRHRRNQYRSITESFTNDNGDLMYKIPDIEFIESVSRNNTVQWNPMEVFTQTDVQSDESYKEQQFAMKLGIDAVDHYSNGYNHGVHTKGILNNGAPGAGKTFVLQIVVLYAISRGLNVMSTSVMAIRAGALGGINIHQFVRFPSKSSYNIFRAAQHAVHELKHRAHIMKLHLLMTLDVLAIDECGSLSAEQLATLDIILRTIKSSSLPFGGVLVLGSFDHRQIDAIKGTPFLMSSHILTDFTIVRLRESVRAAADSALKRIQDITRMTYEELMKAETKEEFVSLFIKNIKCVKSVDKCPPEATLMMNRKKHVEQIRKEYVDRVRAKCESENIPYVESKCIDRSMLKGSRSDMAQTTDKGIVNFLNHKVRESQTLLFFKGALFECTRNDTKSTTKNSQVLLMLDVPSQSEVDNKQDIIMYAAPEGSSRPNSTFIEDPDKLTVDYVTKKMGYTKVSVGIRQSNETITMQNTWIVERVQYPMVHLGCSTVNKTMGCTIRTPVAIEVTTKYSPFDSGQVVVCLSRTNTCIQIYIISDDGIEGAAIRLYETLIRRNQWTGCIEERIANLSISHDNHNSTNNNHHTRTLHLVRDFPFKLTHQHIPKGDGFVYMLCSHKDPSYIYIGQTSRKLRERLNEHNSGRGSKTTKNPAYLPWAPVACIANMGKLTKSEREDLERKWKVRNNEQEHNMANYLRNGQIITQNYNMERNLPPQDELIFVTFVELT